MTYYFVPSLQNMAATKIVARLWNRDDVRALIVQWDLSDIGGCWREIGKKVNEKVMLLLQPASLREKLSSVVLPIGDKIKRWKEIHFRRFRFKNIPREFCWTSFGTMDKKGTAEAFVRDPTLPETERYGMACLYCLEWDRPVPSDPDSESYEVRRFQAYWTCNTTGDATALEHVMVEDTKSPYRHAFEDAVEYSIEVSAEYYLNQLSPEEREESLSHVEVPWTLRDFDFYLFLLRHMNEGQRSKLLEENAYRVLSCLLEWPWQQFFMDMARRVRDNVSWIYHNILVKSIVFKIRDGYEDYNYGELFGTFWGQIPAEHQKDIIRVGHLLQELFLEREVEKVSLVLKGASPEVKEETIFGGGGLLICEILVCRGEWDLLEFFISKCLSSRHRIIHFKKECERSGGFSSAYFQFLDELIRNAAESDGREEADGFVTERLCISSGVQTDQV